MDTEVIRTFLEIVSQGSFGAAAERLHVAQTTVSARIRLLEQRLGRVLFTRAKSGAALTPAGEQLLRYAPTFVQLWERARHQVALPRNKRAVVALGGELSVWNPLLLQWLIWMRQSAPEIAVRAKVGLAQDLNNQVADGVIDLAIVYTPQQRVGVEVELLLNERLVLVTTAGAPPDSPDPDYVYVDWGEEFAMHHNLSFPELSDPGLFVGLGPLALNYILEVGGSGYFRFSAVKRHIASGALRLIPGAPEFSYPAYAVYSRQIDAELIQKLLSGLREVALRIDS
jgi:DNA-binding transcriptional LysR family regulator